MLAGPIEKDLVTLLDIDDPKRRAALAHISDPGTLNPVIPMIIHVRAEGAISLKELEENPPSKIRIRLSLQIGNE
jgi:hypothetical protein